jgi:hypothetical protein
MKKRNLLVGTFLAGLLALTPAQLRAQEAAHGQQPYTCGTERDEDGLLRKITELLPAEEEYGHCDFEAAERNGIDMAAEQDRIMKEAEEAEKAFNNAR